MREDHVSSLSGLVRQRATAQHSTPVRSAWVMGRSVCVANRYTKYHATPGAVRVPNHGSQAKNAHASKTFRLEKPTPARLTPIHAAHGERDP